MAGRTLESASCNNHDKRFLACDPCSKYEIQPEDFGPNVTFLPFKFEELKIVDPVGVAFYDGEHTESSTRCFMNWVSRYLADEAVVVFDDWDRAEVRAGVFNEAQINHRWQLLREMPEYTDGLTCAPHHFGYFFGVSVWGFRR